MLLQGGKPLEGPKEITSNESSQDRNEHVENVKREISSPSKEIIDDVTDKPDKVPKDPKNISPSPTHHLYHFLKGWLRRNMI